MRVLVACEFSGIVREAFRARGHDAFSCDILPSERPSQFHSQGDVAWRLKPTDCWDLIIAHPPCKYLVARGRYRASEMVKHQAEQFFMALINAPAERIAVENPKGVMSRLYRKPDQIIQPWQFGHRERKATCLWLKNLPPLVPTNEVEPELPVHIDSTTGKRRYSLDYLPASSERWRIRSRTFQGIADAMAEQWGDEGQRARRALGEGKSS